MLNVLILLSGRLRERFQDPGMLKYSVLLGVRTGCDSEHFGDHATLQRPMTPCAPSTVQVRNLALGVVARGVDWKKLGFAGTTDSESPQTRTNGTERNRTCYARENRAWMLNPACFEISISTQSNGGSLQARPVRKAITIETFLIAAGTFFGI